MVFAVVRLKEDLLLPTCSREQLENRILPPWHKLPCLLVENPAEPFLLWSTNVVGQAEPHLVFCINH